MVSGVLESAVVCSVNLAEAQGKLVGRGMNSEAASSAILDLIGVVIDFDRPLAILTGSLTAQTQLAGLSLGDRACLATGMRMNVPVYTADRAWRGLKLGIEIHLIR
jgi:PIN domain nuclease of toxin-antitoxin system